MELHSTALPTELRKGKLPPRLELGVVDSKSTVLTNYTIGALLYLICIISLIYVYALIGAALDLSDTVFDDIASVSIKVCSINFVCGQTIF